MRRFLRENSCMIINFLPNLGTKMLKCEFKNVNLKLPSFIY